MKLIGLMVVRDSAWCLRASLDTALQWCDSLAVLVHNSADETESIVDQASHQYHGRIVWSKTDEPEWNEATFRQQLLDVGRSMQGTHFAIIDADEILAMPMIKIIRAAAEFLSPRECLRLPWIHCWRSLFHYRSDESAFGRAWVPVLFCDSGMVRYVAAGGYQLHHRMPQGLSQPKEFGSRDCGGIMHLQHVNWTRVQEKQINYIEQELRRWPGRRPEIEVRQQYMATLNEDGLQTRDVPPGWWSVDPMSIDVSAMPQIVTPS